MAISDRNLPFYYLFPGAKVLYRNRPYAVLSVNKKGIDIYEIGNGIKRLSIDLDDHSLSIPDYLFIQNYNRWVRSLGIGEEVDFYINNDDNRNWYRGIIDNITFEGEEVTSVTIRTSLKNDPNYPDYYQTIHGFSTKSIGRPFSRAREPSPGLQPYRLVFERNLLIPNTNHMILYNKIDAVNNENGTIYPSLYITILNLITQNNIWHSISCAMDVSISSEYDMQDLVTINAKHLRNLLNLYCSVIHLFYQETRTIITDILFVPLLNWILTLSTDV